MMETDSEDERAVFVDEELSDEDLIVEDESGKGNALAHAANIQVRAAEFLTFIKQQCVTTQVTVDSVVKGVDELFQLYNLYLKAKLFELSDSDTVRKEDMEKVFSYMSRQTIFEGVQSRYRLEKYQKLNWDAVLPRKIVFSWKKALLHGKVREVPSTFAYYVDFLEQLESLLQCEDILNCIDNPKPPSKTEPFRSILDGYVYQNHPVVQKHPGALAIVLFLDDVKTGDTLSSYDLGMRNFLWTLANVYPELRSVKQAINLLALAKASTAKACKNGPILKNFIEGINKLSSEEGVTFNIRGKRRVFHGFLLIVIGDYPAQGNIGGFKESAAFAWRFCRQCLVTQHEKSLKYEECQVTLRDAASHQQHLEAIEGNVMVEDVEEESGKSEKATVNYGVNFKSPLLDIKYFDVTRCLPQDIMHLFLEGIVETECRFVLSHAISDKKLPLKQVNSFIANFDYGKQLTDKPSPIESQHLKNGLRQTSSQMLMLSTMVPFIVKDHCDKAKLENLILLLKILGLCLSHSKTLAVVSVLRSMIKNYLGQFNLLYPGKFTPKHHFLIHLPTQIVYFAVLTEQWAMRYEAFHAGLKRLAEILHNAKNQEFSLMMRMTASQAYKIHVNKSDYLSHSAIVPKVKQKMPLAQVPKKQDIIACLKLTEDCEVVELSRLKWYGLVLSVGDIILVTPSSANYLPTFAAVISVFCVQKKYVLLYREMRTVSYCGDLNAYEVKSDQVALSGAMDITDEVNLTRAVYINQGSVDYVVLRRNANPELS